MLLDPQLSGRMNNTSDAPVVIFGDQRSAQLAHHCLVHDSSLRVLAFTVDAAYRKANDFDGLPLFDFETLEAHCPPDQVQLLIPMGYQHINGVRRARYEQAKARGYRFASYVSSRASVWGDLRLGENCLIYDNAIVQPFTTIGDNVIVRSGAHISHHGRVDSHAFIAPMAALAGSVHVGEQAFIGTGAVVIDQVHIAPRSFIGAGAVVTRATEADGVYVGNPARRLARSAAQMK